MAPPLNGGPDTLERRLLQAAADGDLRLFKGIASALEGGKGRIVEAMEAVRDRGAGALHVTAGRGRMAVCRYLVEELDMDVGAADESVRGGTVRFVLDHGADSNKSGLCEMIEALLSKGADVDLFSYCGTPLHAAIIGKQDAAVNILWDHHADISLFVVRLCNKAIWIHYTPLIAALHVRSLKCVKLLIKAGADVKGVAQLKPLIVAANEGLTGFCKCLLDAGVDPDVCDDGGHLPIEIAAHNNRRKYVELLFPVTSRIPYVHDWSVDGILSYVKSVPKEDM